MSAAAKPLSLPYMQVDVFTDHALAGNPAAVVFDGESLTDESLQGIARETNLSETVFVLRPLLSEADYRVRIFTVRREIDFAGHPTLAAAHAVAANRFDGNRPPAGVLRQEGRIGITAVEWTEGLESGESPFVTLPSASQRTTQLTTDDVSRLLGIPADRFAAPVFPVVATGVPWLLAQLRSMDDLSRIEVDTTQMVRATRSVAAVGLVAFTRECRPGVVARMRSFAPAEGIHEDPVCGSCHGAVAAYLLATGAVCTPISGDVSRLIFEQGHEIARPGRSEILVRTASGGPIIKLGGNCVTVLSGQLFV